MLTRKTVAIAGNQMHLWDEAGNFVCSYDMHTDGEMCRFLRTMIGQDTYRLSGQPGAPSRSMVA